MTYKFTVDIQQTVNSRPSWQGGDNVKRKHRRYEDYTVKELKEIAKTKNLKSYSRLCKSDLINLIRRKK